MPNRQRLALVEAQRRQVRAQPTTLPLNLPPPLKGWNTRDALEAMDEADAIALDNLQPDYGGVRMRDGCQVYIDNGGADPVCTLAVWRGSGAGAGGAGENAQMLAASGRAIWRADQAGTPPLRSGFNSDWWQTTNFNGRLFFANGRDAMQIYDGAALGDLVIDVDPAPPTGGAIYPPFDPTAIVGIATVHNRLFFWTGREPGFWYTNAPYVFQGDVLHWYPFDMLVASGAHLLWVNALTYDAGLGPQSLTVFMLSSGELLLYQGSDPDNPEDWGLAGIYTLPAPPVPDSGAPRSAARYGGDTYLVTSSDYTKLSQLLAALKAGTMPPRGKASGAAIAAVGQGRTLPGWQITYWGYGRRLIINVPLAAPDPGANGAQFEQHVYNTGLDGWCRYRGLDAYCWVQWGDRLFFGTKYGTVCEFGVPGGDELRYHTYAWARVGSGAPDAPEFPSGNKWNTTLWQIRTYNPITILAQQAWQRLGGVQAKRLAAMRLLIQSAGAISYSFGVGFDYGPVTANIPVSYAGNATRWNVTPWGSPWQRSTEVDTLWYVCEGDGSAFSVIWQGTIGAPTPPLWLRSDFRVEPGMAL